MGSRRVLLVPALLVLSLSGCRTVPIRPAGKPVERTMLTTGYCACGQCCGWRRTCWGVPVYASGPKRGLRKQVGVTAIGTRARHGTIAADMTRYPFHALMYIDGYGYGWVEDTGGDIKGDHIDLFFPSHREAVAWGRRVKRVQIWYPRRRRRLTRARTRTGTG